MELVVLSAPDDSALVTEMGNLIRFIDRMPDARLEDVAYTVSLKRGESVIAFVVSSVEDLRARLSSARDRMNSGIQRIRDKSGTYWFRDRAVGEGLGKLAFVFPGAMSFYPDMLRDLAATFPECRAPFDILEEAMADDPEFTPSNFIFPPASYYRHDADVFSSGAYAEAFVSTTTACVALSDLLDRIGLVPDGIVGCAGGDLAATFRSGAAGFDRPRADRVRTIREIYKTVSKAIKHGGMPKAAMLTALAKHEEDFDAAVAAVPKDAMCLAGDFAPLRRTYAVEPDFEDTVLDAFKNAGVRAIKHEFDRPFNTPRCKAVVDGVRKFASGIVKKEPVCEVWSCATASILPKKPRLIRGDMSERWGRPVRFRETIRAMYDAGYRVFVEVGPRGLMTSAIGEIFKDGKDVSAVALDSINRRGLLQLQHGLAQIAALGGKINLAPLFSRKGCRKLDFKSEFPLESRKDTEMALRRDFPRLSLLGEITSAATYMQEPKGRGAKAAARAAAKAAKEGLRLQFEAGSADPLISDAPPTSQTPGISYEFVKEYRISDVPFIGDFAYGASQLSYSDPNLKGLVILPIPLVVEIMAETALRVVPNRHLVSVENFNCTGQAKFVRGSIRLRVHAERVSPSDPRTAAVRVQIRKAAPEDAFTLPLMEAVVILAKNPLPTAPSTPEPLVNPRSVHWSGREIYPLKLGFGPRLRGIVFVENWSENGLDYEIEVPPLAGNVTFTRLPLWAVNPLLIHNATSGFRLWRSNDRFRGAFSYPIRFRRLEVRGPVQKEGARLNAYLRLTGVTPESQLSDITVTDGNGGVILQIDGWEELTERVPKILNDIVLQPASTFISESVSADMFGDPGTNVASAMITDVPYSVFGRNNELWFSILSSVVLNAAERKQLEKINWSVSRRTEWLFGRIAVKEAVRRYLKDYHQARWSYADVQIWLDESGKPQAIGAWGDNMTSRLDVAIAHTSKFVIALAASNARVGVDVETLERNLSEEFTSGAFIQEEIELAAAFPNSAQALIRFWCAKEAVSKALGTGLKHTPKDIVVTGYLPDSGSTMIRLTGAWLDTFKSFRGRDIPVTSRMMRGHVLAFCFIPASLFRED